MVLPSAIEDSARELAARSAPSRIWSEAESILAFLLLVYLDPARLGGTTARRAQHPAVIALAKITGRNDDAVVMKVQNQRFVLTSGNRGLPGGSARDRDVVQRYALTLDLLWGAVEVMRPILPGLSALLAAVGYDVRDDAPEPAEELRGEALPRPPIPVPPGGTSVRRDVLARRGQRPFRNRVLANYGSRCAVCVFQPATPGASTLFLRAGHIRPWADATDHQRLDPTNGLSLCVVHDRAFEGGLFTLAENLAVVKAPRARELFANDDSFEHALGTLRPRIKPTRKDFDEPGEEYLAYHREVVFERAGWAG